MTDDGEARAEEELDRQIARDEFKKDVLDLAANIFLRGLVWDQQRHVFRIKPREAVERAAQLVMTARDEVTLSEITARIAKEGALNDPLVTSNAPSDGQG